MPAVRRLVRTERHRLRVAVGRVHRQGQRVDAVATAHRLQAVGIDTAGAQALAMPAVRRRVGTERHRLRIIVGRVHQQGVLADAVAAVRCLQVQHVGLGRIEGMAAPYVRQRALAYRHRVIEVVGRVHDGVHHIDIVAALGVHHRVAVLAGRGDGLTTPGLRHALAQLDGRILDLHDGGDGQGQRINAVATIHGLQAVVVDATDIQVTIVPYIRQVGAANTFSLLEMIRRGHRQGESIDAVAAILRLQAVVVHTAGGQALAMPAVRRLIGAERHRLTEAVGRVHRQGQRVDAVATAHRLQAVGIDTAGDQALAMPAVWCLVGTDGHRLHIVVGRIHHQHQTIDAIAEGDSLIVGIIGAGSRQGAVTPLIRQLIVADGHRLREEIGRMDGHVNFVDIITALGVHHRVAIETALRDGTFTPCVGFAFADIHRISGEDGRRLHGQGQRIDTVAAVHRLQAVVVGASRIERTVMPQIRHIVATYGGFLLECIGRVHRQGQRDDAIATVNRSSVENDVGGTSRGHIQEGVGGGEVVRGVRLARCRCQGLLIGRVHRHDQLADAVTARQRLQCVGIATTLAKRSAMPAVGLAFAEVHILRGTFHIRDDQVEGIGAVAAIDALVVVGVLAIGGQ